MVNYSFLAVVFLIIGVNKQKINYKNNVPMITFTKCLTKIISKFKKKKRVRIKKINKLKTNQSGNLKYIVNKIFQN